MVIRFKKLYTRYLKRNKKKKKKWKTAASFDAICVSGDRVWYGARFRRDAILCAWIWYSDLGRRISWKKRSIILHHIVYNVLLSNTVLRVEHWILQRWRVVGVFFSFRRFDFRLPTSKISSVVFQDRVEKKFFFFKFTFVWHERYSVNQYNMTSAEHRYVNNSLIILLSRLTRRFFDKQWGFYCFTEIKMLSYLNINTCIIYSFSMLRIDNFLSFCSIWTESLIIITLICPNNKKKKMRIIWYYSRFI